MRRQRGEGTLTRHAQITCVGGSTFADWLRQERPRQGVRGRHGKIDGAVIVNEMHDQRRRTRQQGTLAQGTATRHCAIIHNDGASESMDSRWIVIGRSAGTTGWSCMSNFQGLCLSPRKVPDLNGRCSRP